MSKQRALLSVGGAVKLQMGTGQGRAGQDRAGQGRTGQGWVKVGRPVGGGCRWEIKPVRAWWGLPCPVAWSVCSLNHSGLSRLGEVGGQLHACHAPLETSLLSSVPWYLRAY